MPLKFYGMSKAKLLLFSTFSGLLFALAWPSIGDSTLTICMAFFPLLWVEEQISKSGKARSLQVFFNAYVAFFVFNLLTTWWIYYASAWGAAMAIICNSLFMAIVFLLFHITKMKVGRKEGYIGLIIYWIAFEYLHINWELSWTWLTLGNVFANDVGRVQWYEYTGVLGGSLYILVINLLFFFALKDLKGRSNIHFRYLGIILFLLFGSGIVSRIILPEEKESEKLEVVIVQPNIDPYKEKFGGLSPSEQIDRMIGLAKEELTTSTDYLIFPETAIPEAHWEHEIEYLIITEEIRKLRTISPKLKTLIGSSSSVLYVPGQELSATANAFRDGSGYYDNYNSAIYIDSSKEVQIHHKSKLVLGVEKLPFIRSIPLMKKLSINLGGTSGGLGSQESPSVFKSKAENTVLAPIICYESIYGEYVTEYSNKGANLFAIITNDGWWDDTPGYKQHLAYARLRAIENRRAIVRSANTGISAIINAKGEVIEQTKWWEQDVIKGEVALNNESTFYVRYGDYIGRIAAFVAPLLLLLTLVKKLNKTEQRLGIKKA